MKSHLVIISTEHYYLSSTTPYRGHAVAQWLRHCPTNRKVMESIPNDVIGIFHNNN
jgi:hypothetical protein